MTSYELVCTLPGLFTCGKIEAKLSHTIEGDSSDSGDNWIGWTVRGDGLRVLYLVQV